MSYARYSNSGHYIYSNGEELFLDNVSVPEDLIDIFLYKLVKERKVEFFQRLKHGKQLIKEWKENSKSIDKIVK